ncbi:MAG: HAMP domain-containing histidine kinase [Ruminococcaceae bacterium]|nr:HAMP domain-containing histidine kinase [Oscillospiraceae bacterium]
MKKSRRNTALKALSLLMLSLLVLLSGGLLMCAKSLQEHGAYETEQLSDSPILDEVMDFNPDALCDIRLYESENAQLDFRMKYALTRNGKPCCNTVVTVTHPGGKTMLSNYDAEVIPSAVKKLTLTYITDATCPEPSFEFSPGHDNPVSYIAYYTYDPISAENISFREWLFDQKGINTEGLSDNDVNNSYLFGYQDEYNDYLISNKTYTLPEGYYNVTLGIAEESVVRFSEEHFLISTFEFRNIIPVIAAICAVLAIVPAVYLCFAAGWRTEGDVPSPSFFERIPLGIFLILSGGAVYGIVRLIMHQLPLSGAGVPKILFCALLTYLAVLIVISAVYSLIARMKCRGWWKDTLIYRVSILPSQISDIGTVIACCGCWLLVNILLLVCAITRPVLGILLFSIFNALAALIVLVVTAQWQKLRKSAQTIADGNFSHRVDTGGLFKPLKEHGKSINRMGEGVRVAVDEQMKSERMKTDLITNVSHDLKTPLTSIVSYVGLLKNEAIDNPTAREYIDTLDRQATRLGRLIEDLVEASRATSGCISAQLMPLNIGELTEQAVSEYEMRLEQSRITPIVSLKSESLTAMADGRLLWRVIDNLLSNVCKYGLPCTRLYIDVCRQGDSVTMSFRNISAIQLNIPPDELMERFVRGDNSRTTSGSGLGLTIARSLTELQNGTFTLEIEGDLFRTHISLPAAAQSTVESED